MRNLVSAFLLALFLTWSPACGGPEPGASAGEGVASTAAAVTVWPTIPSVPPHNQNNPNQICAYSCASGASAGNRCPCVLNPPPGARWCDSYGSLPNPGVGEAAIYSDEWEGFGNWGQCVIIPSGVAYDYFWLALNGFESDWPRYGYGGVPKGIVQAILGPNTTLWFSSATKPAMAGSDSWTVTNYSATQGKRIFSADHGGCNVNGPYFYTSSCDPYGDLELPAFPAYWIGSVFSEQARP